MGRRTRPKRQRANGKVNVDDLVDAALRIVKRDGLSGLSMRTLSEELGLSVMAAYYHVRDKEHLLDLLQERIQGDLYDAVAAADAESPGRRLNRMFWRLAELYESCPGLILRLRPTVPGKEQRRIQALAAELLRQLGVSPELVPIAEFATGLFSFAAIVSLEGLSEAQKVEAKQRIDQAARMIVRGALALSKQGGSTPTASTGDAARQTIPGPSSQPGADGGTIMPASPARTTANRTSRSKIRA